MRKLYNYFTFTILLLSHLIILNTFASDISISTDQYHTDIQNHSLITHSSRELIVRIRPNSTFAELQAFSKQLGAESVSSVFSLDTPGGQDPLLNCIYIIRFPTGWDIEKLRQRYAADTMIEDVEMNRLNRFCAEITPNDSRYSEQWNLSAMNMPKAWHIETGKPSVVIAVVDSGIMQDHPELRQQLWQNPAEIADNGIDDDQNGYIDDIYGWDFSDAPTLQGQGDWTTRDNDPNDETGHGTQVTGIIAAQANNEIGISGIAWNCRLMPLRAGFRIGGGGFFQNDDVAAAIVYAADNGAHVINLSLGDTVNAFLIQGAVEYAYSRGCVLVAAAGNSSEPGSFYPAALENVISVAAIDREFQLGSSNFGSSIDVAAPGEEILTTDIFTDEQSSVLNGYGYKSGTSMAAPHISGVAALLISSNPSCSNVQVQRWITDTSRRLSIANLVGAGLVDANAALTSLNGLIADITVEKSLQLEITENSNIINIFGSAGGTGFRQFWLDYGITETPNLWFQIGIPQTEPKYNTVLHEWDTSTLDEGIYTLRLSVQSNDEETIRNKAVAEIRHTLPQISGHDGSEWLSGNRYDATIIWKTDVLTIGSVEIYEQAEAQTPIRVIHSDSVHRQHVVYLSELALPSGEYLYCLKTQNRVGKVRIDNNNGNFYPISVSSEQIPSSHLIPTTAAQYGLHAVVTQHDINGNSQLELIGVETDTTTAHIFETDNHGNPTKISTLEQSLSRIWGTADTDGDGLIELLCNEGKNTFLLEQPASEKYPTIKIWEVNGIWGGTIDDMDLDGKPEIYSRHDDSNSIYVYESDGNNSYNNIAQLENPTEGRNNILTRFATGDFDRDGQIEILSGDSEGELFIYENVGDNLFQQTWVDTLSEGVPHLFATGDMDGNGSPEFVVGSEVWATEFDLPRQHWLFTIYTSDGNDSYRAVWNQRIRVLQDGESGISIADANNDGRNELCITVPPNFYLLQYDGTAYQPIWHHTATSTFNPIVADIDNDGNNELMFNNDNVFTVFSNTLSNGDVKSTSDTESIISTSPPHIISAVHSPSNQLLITFDKQMDISGAIPSRYKLHRFKELNTSDVNTEFYTPNSAIFDRSQKRVVLTFASGVFQSDYQYKIEVIQLSDINGAEITEENRNIVVEYQTQSHQNPIVYPNPARGDNITFDRLSVDSNIEIYDIVGNRIALLMPTVEDIVGNRCSRIWSLEGVSSGVYIYVIESSNGRKIGKISVIR